MTSPSLTSTLQALNPAERAALVEALAAGTPTAGRDLAAVAEKLLDGKDMLGALNLPPETVDLLYGQAFARFNAGATQQAALLFQALCALSPDRSDHWLGLGICLRRQGLLDAALTALATAEALVPEGSTALDFHLCEIACARQDWSSAKSRVRAFAARPENRAKTQLLGDMRRLAAVIEHRAG